MPTGNGRDSHNMWREMPPSKKKIQAQSDEEERAKQEALNAKNVKGKSDKRKKPAKNIEDNPTKRKKSSKQRATEAQKGQQSNLPSSEKVKAKKRSREQTPQYYDDKNIAKPIDIQEKALKNKTRNRIGEGTVQGTGKRRRRASSYTLYFILVAFVAVVIVMILSFTVFFKLKKIEVTGETVYSAAEVQQLCSEEMGENIWLIDDEKIEKRLIDAFPYVDKVTVSKKPFLEAIEIHLNQAKPLANIVYENKYYLISANGRIMDSELKSPDKSCVIVNGFNPEFAVSGDFISVSDEGGRNYLTKLLKCVKDYSGLLQEDDGSTGKKPDVMYELIEAYTQVGMADKIKDVDISNIYAIKLNYDNQLKFNIGEINDVKIKLTIAKNLIDKGEFDGETGELNLSLAADPAHNMKVTFTPYYTENKPSDSKPDNGDQPIDNGGDETSSVDDNVSEDDNSDDIVIGETTPPRE